MVVRPKLERLEKRVQLENIVPLPQTRVLAVDDNPASLKIIEILLEQDGKYDVVTAENGRQAYHVLQENQDSVDIILLDRIMPEMDGIEFCRKIKSEDAFRTIPVIMQTAAGKPQEIREGIEAGVFYYLVKPLVADTLLSILDSARKKVKRYRKRHSELLQHKESMAMVDSIRCTCRTLDEAEVLSAFLSRFFPHPDLAITGITELLINAVEHGNLEISFEEKTELLNSNRWLAEVEARLKEAPYRNRVVSVTLEKKLTGFVLKVVDQGKGFDWRGYLDIDTGWATLNHGRGIAMAKMMSFDKVEYNEKGNAVTATVFSKFADQEVF